MMNRRQTSFLALATIVLLTAQSGVSACSVCYGDPNSDMAKGAAMGVWVLAGVIGFVLTIVAGTSLFWIHRGRQLHRANAC